MKEVYCFLQIKPNLLWLLYGWSTNPSLFSLHAQLNAFKASCYLKRLSRIEGSMIVGLYMLKHFDYSFSFSKSEIVNSALHASLTIDSLKTRTSSLISTSIMTFGYVQLLEWFYFTPEIGSRILWIITLLIHG